jgi:HK97 family phage major capsid protein
MNINDTRVERRKLWESMKAMLDKVEAEKRKFTAEEEAQYAKIETDLDAKGKEIEEAEKAENRRKVVDKYGEEMKVLVDEPIKPGAEEKADKVPIETRALRNFLLNGSRSLSPAEIRALQVDADTAGGYTRLPQQFVTELIKAVDNLTFMRGLSTVYTVTNAESLGAPALDANPADPTWTAEILIGSEDSTMAFGKRELRPHPLAQYIKVSKKLLRASTLGVESLVRDRLAYKAAVVMENAYLNGDGSNEPLGVFEAPVGFGITTSQDVSTGNTDTEIRCDGLIEAKYKLKGQYWNKCRWIFHRNGVKKIRKLKDGEGQYIWRSGIAGDRGDTILDVPVLMSEYVPDTWTSGLYVGIIGDFSKYWIADALGMEIQVLTELYAATNQNGYILRAESDGMPVLEEAFARVALA